MQDRSVEDFPTSLANPKSETTSTYIFRTRVTTENCQRDVSPAALKLGHISEWDGRMSNIEIF